MAFGQAGHYPAHLSEPGNAVSGKKSRILEIYNTRYCSWCQQENMVSIHRLPKRGPPKATFSLVFLLFGILILIGVENLCPSKKKPFQNESGRSEKPISKLGSFNFLSFHIIPPLRESKAFYDSICS